MSNYPDELFDDDETETPDGRAVKKIAGQLEAFEKFWLKQTAADVKQLEKHFGVRPDRTLSLEQRVRRLKALVDSKKCKTNTGGIQ